jgi:hypothetical protein
MEFEFNSEDHYPIIADTSALLAVAGTEYADLVFSELGITTTEICLNEIKRNENRASPSTRNAATAILKYHSDSAFPSPTVVPVPDAASNPDPGAGEDSIEAVINEYPNCFSKFLMVDVPAMAQLINSGFPETNKVQILPPNDVFLLLYELNELTKQEFCEVCAEMLGNEGWDTDELLTFIWKYSPVDCNPYITSRFLP